MDALKETAARTVPQLEILLVCQVVLVVIPARVILEIFKRALKWATRKPTLGKIVLRNNVAVQLIAETMFITGFNRRIVTNTKFWVSHFSLKSPIRNQPSDVILPHLNERGF
jgi:hypothetical protein